MGRGAGGGAKGGNWDSGNSMYNLKQTRGEREVETYTCPTITVTTEGLSPRTSGLISHPPGLGQCLCLGFCSSSAKAFIIVIILISRWVN